MSGTSPWDIPVEQPPAGQISNFIDPPSQAPILRVGIYIIFPLMLSFVAARLYTRACIFHALGIDDFLCVIATAGVLSYGSVLLAILNLKPLSPLGRHKWDIPVAAFTDEYFELLIIASATVSAAAMLVKLTILALYHRIFQPVLWAKRSIWAGVILVATFYSVLLMVLLVPCVPIHGESWLAKTTHGACPTVQVKNSQAQGIFGLVSDLYILAIPISQVSRLSLAPKRKAGVLVVFLTGIFAIASSIGGLASREQITLTDVSFLTTPSLFGLLEISIGLICSCMPVITAPLKILIAKMISSWHSIKQYSRTILSSTDRDPRERCGQLPEIPGGGMSGLRTFIRRCHRSNVQSTPMSYLSHFVSLESDTDWDYHGQLRDLCSVDIERPAPVTLPKSHRYR
ncbi:hypothetical protein F4809DRAFT_656422 [Biscogniauxia mediterranea]|nr:hypothetical protein F4809DRAFT_656422 [Biscogniauxia mediterranea]